MTDERRRNMTMVYGSLAYDLDSLVRERQLEEAGRPPLPRSRRRSAARRRRPKLALLRCW